MKIIKFLGYGLGGVIGITGLTYVGLRLYSPPYYPVEPDRVDLGASGTPALPLPLGKEETFEPTVAINANNPDHVMVVAMYGNRRGTGANYLYRWRSMDGGKNWSGDTVPTAAYEGKFVADAVAGINTDGTEHVISMFGNFEVPDDLALLDLIALAQQLLNPLDPGAGKEMEPDTGGGISFVNGEAKTGKFSAPTVVSKTEMGRTDKTWMAVDTSEASPFKGNIYGAWSIFPGGLGNVVFTTSQDRGKTYSTPINIMNPGYTVAVATRPNGIVDVIGVDEVEKTVVHVSSNDGGKSFSRQAPISGPKADGVARDFPTLTVGHDGTVLACWSESDKANLSRVKCATQYGSSPWAKPIDLAPNVPGTAKMGFPAVAANDAGFWLLAYKSETTTDVVLYRSTDKGKSFTPYQTLGSRPFAADEICIPSLAGTQCRFYFNVSHTFVPGDYVGLAASGTRVVAAFPLTRGKVPYMFVNTYVKVVDVHTLP